MRSILHASSACAKQTSTHELVVQNMIELLNSKITLDTEERLKLRQDLVDYLQQFFSSSLDLSSSLKVEMDDILSISMLILNISGVFFFFFFF